MPVSEPSTPAGSLIRSNRSIADPRPAFGWHRGPSAASRAADSTATQQQKKKGGLFAFLRRGGSDEPKEEEKEERPSVPVEMAAVGRKDVPSFFTGTATVEADGGTGVWYDQNVDGTHSTGLAGPATVSSSSL